MCASLTFGIQWLSLLMFDMWPVSVLVLVAVISVGYSYLPLPPYLKACHKDLPDFDNCTLKQAQLGLPLLLNGDKDYGIPSLNPIELDLISMEAAGNFNINLTKVKIYGPAIAEVTKLKIDPIAKTFELGLTERVLTILSEYEMSGRILLLPLEGKGNANITASNISYDYGFTYELKPKNGEEYVFIVEQHVDYVMDKVSVNFTNLFKGNEKLGENTNKLLNDEWTSIADELKPVISETIKTIASSIVTGIFKKVPARFILP